MGGVQLSLRACVNLIKAVGLIPFVPCDCHVCITAGNSSGVMAGGKSSSFPENLRLSLVAFQSAYEAARAELSTSKSQLAVAEQSINQITSECTTYRETLTEKSLALSVRGMQCLFKCIPLE